VADFGPGEVTVEGRLLKENGDLVGQQRQINIELSEEDYLQATNAHRDRRDLKVEGRSDQTRQLSRADQCDVFRRAVMIRAPLGTASLTRWTASV